MTTKRNQKNQALAILAYILAPVPYFVEKKDPFVRYHAIQGLNILIVAVAYSLVQSIILRIVSFFFCTECLLGGITYDILAYTLGLVGLGIFALDIVGLVYAAQGKTKSVPILGKIKIITK